MATMAVIFLFPGVATLKNEIRKGNEVFSQIICSFPHFHKIYIFSYVTFEHYHKTFINRDLNRDFLASQSFGTKKIYLAHQKSGA